MEYSTVCASIGEIPAPFVLSTGLRLIMLGGRSKLLELQLCRLIFMGRNPCQSPQLKVDIYSLQFLMNVSSFSFLIRYPIDSFYTFRGSDGESKQEMFESEICFFVSKEMRERNSWK